jgi:hypothetical protein
MILMVTFILHPPPIRGDNQDDQPIKIIATSTLSKFQFLDIYKQDDVPTFGHVSDQPLKKSVMDITTNEIGSDYCLGDTSKHPIYLTNHQSLPTALDKQ